MCQALTALQSMMFTVILGLRLNTLTQARHTGAPEGYRCPYKNSGRAGQLPSVRETAAERAPAAIAAIPSSPELEERLDRARANTLQPAIEHPKRLVARRNHRVSAPWRGLR